MYTRPRVRLTQQSQLLTFLLVQCVQCARLLNVREHIKVCWWGVLVGCAGDVLVGCAGDVLVGCAGGMCWWDVLMGCAGGM